MIARSLRDLVSAPVGSLAIETIVLKKSQDLVCRNMFCDKVGLPCLCKLEHALSSPHLDLSNIKRLDLSSNKLTSLPPSIEKMINLEELNLSNNSLCSLPQHLKKLERLELLDLSVNPLESQLKSSRLNRNDIFSIPETLFLNSS
jgi:Leucine-rich repeat (LRR) protein